MSFSAADFAPGMIVRITAFDEIPEHLFQVDEVYDDLITGYSLTGPLAGEYGEPDFSLVLAIETRGAPQG